jgi:hypothetical protein
VQRRRRQVWQQGQQQQRLAAALQAKLGQGQLDARLQRLECLLNSSSSGNKHPLLSTSAGSSPGDGSGSSGSSRQRRSRTAVQPAWVEAGVWPKQWKLESLLAGQR